MSNNVAEHDLPGIGRRYIVDGIDGGQVVVVLHHTGRRDLYVLDPASLARGSGDADPDEPAAVLTLTDDQARRLGAILAGAYFKPAIVAQVEAVIGGLLIDWATVRDDSPAAGHSIAELEIRRRTRMTVAAIACPDGSSVIAPEPHEVMRAGDQLVVVGRPEDFQAFLDLVVD